MKRKKTQQRILHPLAQEFAVVIVISDSYLHSRADCIDGFIQVVKLTDKMQIVLVGAIVGPLHMVWENAALDEIDSIWLVSIHVDLEIYCTG